MTAHAIVIETEGGAVRWRCSCTATGEWLVVDHVKRIGRTPATRCARSGGQRHVAAMERGRDPFAVLRQPGKGGARTTDGNTREIAKHERRAAIARGVMRRGER